jgi:hypothetical protein
MLLLTAAVDCRTRAALIGTNPQYRSARDGRGRVPHDVVAVRRPPSSFSGDDSLGDTKAKPKKIQSEGSRAHGRVTCADHAWSALLLAARREARAATSCSVGGGWKGARLRAFGLPARGVCFERCLGMQDEQICFQPPRTVAKNDFAATDYFRCFRYPPTPETIIIILTDE